MPRINIPKNTLDKSSLKSLPAKEKEEYVRNLLREILQLNPGGVTISQIKEATGLTYSTLWHHLEVLSSTAQGYKISHGSLDIYYPPGKIEPLTEIDHDNAKYVISLTENPNGHFLCIQEQRQNRRGNQTICRGIAIPTPIIDDLIKVLNKVKKSTKKGK